MIRAGLPRGPAPGRDRHTLVGDLVRYVAGWTGGPTRRAGSEYLDAPDLQRRGRSLEEQVRQWLAACGSNES